MKEKKEITNTNESLKQNLYEFLLIFFIVVLVCNIFILLNWNIERKNSINEIKEIDQITDVTEIENNENTELINPPDDENSEYWNYVDLPLLDVNLEELKEINSDTVGFINVKEININYPVVQTENNSYYLNHSFKKESNKAGWIFADYRNNLESLDKNTIIYGHNRLDDTMFATLRNTLESEWLNNKDNHVVQLSTLTKNTLWQVFSVYTIPEESYYINVDFSNDEEYQNWLNIMLERSIYDFSTNVNTNDKILTLSTCYNNNNTRVVLQAKLIKKQDI